MSAYTQKRSSGSTVIVIVICTAVLAAAPASAACVNKFTHHDQRLEHVVTLLTGKLTFQDAQALAAAIRERKAAPITWVDERGKTIATQFGELKVVRPMPVSCEGSASGVVMIATFATVQVPQKKILVKFSPTLTVEFEEQNE